MLHDAGILKVCNLIEVSIDGNMPKRTLSEVCRHFYGEYSIGYARQYAAKGVNEQIDLIAEIDVDRAVRIGQYGIIDDDSQYVITNVQHLVGDDGIRNTLVTMQRLGEMYDVAVE